MKKLITFKLKEDLIFQIMILSFVLEIMENI